jgi:transposase
MNIHKNARLTLIPRVEMVEDVLLSRLPRCQVAAHFGVSEATVRKWLGRFLAEGREDLMDRSSRPVHSPLALEAGKALTIVELRKKRMTQARIAQYLQISKATVTYVSLVNVVGLA